MHLSGFFHSDHTHKITRKKRNRPITTSQRPPTRRLPGFAATTTIADCCQHRILLTTRGLYVSSLTTYPHFCAKLLSLSSMFEWLLCIEAYHSSLLAVLTLWHLLILDVLPTIFPFYCQWDLECYHVLCYMSSSVFEDNIYRDAAWSGSFKITLKKWILYFNIIKELMSIIFLNYTTFLNGTPSIKFHLCKAQC